MPKVIFRTNDGKSYEHEIKLGWSVMQGAMRNSVPGIDAECGGSASCATCHVYVDDAWVARAGAPSDFEREMLDAVPTARSNSRLSCQITLSAELDGLVVDLPVEQINVSI